MPACLVCVGAYQREGAKTVVSRDGANQGGSGGVTVTLLYPWEPFQERGREGERVWGIELYLVGALLC